MISAIEGRRILLGVTGSIAAYKAVDLASKLTQSGADVDVILTHAALKFVSALTFQSVTGRRAYSDEDLWGKEGHVQHIGLGKDADLFLIAPATANTIAKLAHGLADNLLAVTALAVTCPIMLAPAMDGGMYAHAATQSNIAILKDRQLVIIGPAEGHLASGMQGIGRMVEPQELLGYVSLLLSRTGPLSGTKILITAGGTQEAIDPVRVITNRSSGKQGFALARAALDLGADVTLVSAPVHLSEPVGVLREDVGSAQEMHEAVMKALPDIDVLIMAAAVADFKPESIAKDKIKKSSGMQEIRLERTQDILMDVATFRSQYNRPNLVVGFAAESQDLLENARAKLKAKNLDLIVANDIRASDAGFGVDTNRITLIDRAGDSRSFPLMSKDQVARLILDEVIRLIKS